MVGLMVSLMIAHMRQVKLTTVIDHLDHSKRSSNIATSAHDALHTFLSPVVPSYASSGIYNTS